ncbi:MAG: hypothetical protein M5R36_10025 [Deltaproteobacteria bacterium]|nr:hypothetical protein [Deltaproteobacteria bacterium]
MSKAIAKGKEVIVEVPNTPGAAADVLDALGEAKINVYGMVGYADLADSSRGWVHLVCKDAHEARKVLSQAGFRAQVKDVLVANVNNKPGQLADMMKKAAGRGVNLDHLYGSAVGKTGVIVFSTRNLGRAMKALGT